MSLQSIIERLKGDDGRNWPTVSAKIDVVSVSRQEEHHRTGAVTSYLATLTYFYRNPDLQTGDYCRIFGEYEEDAAQAWAANYKGSEVMVHVDPHDGSRSVLLDEDLPPSS